MTTATPFWAGAGRAGGEEGMSEIDEVRDRLLERAVARLLAEGKTEAEARALAERALAAPPSFTIPTIAELAEKSER